MDFGLFSKRATPCRLIHFTCMNITSLLLLLTRSLSFFMMCINTTFYRYRSIFIFLVKDGATLLVIVATYGHLEVVEMLLDHGARIETENNVR
jgi:hypothetical protein